MLEKKLKLIIDTDNGDDIDDLITLYFALSHKEVEIVGIISSYLNSPLRKKQVEHVLNLFNVHDIPLFAGCQKPIATLHPNDINTVYCQYTDELGDAGVCEEDEAINFLIESAKKYGDELTILEIAPETTLAQAIRKDREAFTNTHIRIMGGAFYKPVSEWNIECDYASAKTILESGLNLTYVGLDVTDLSVLEDPHFENMLLGEHKDPKLRYLSKCSNIWVNCSKRHIVLHDPLTFLTLIDDSLCEFKQERVRIDIDLKEWTSFIRLDPNSNYQINVASSLNIPRLMEHLENLTKED